MLKGLSGAKWRATHQASVDGMLHDLNVRRPVKSFGSVFSNRDRWTGRALFTAMNRYNLELQLGLRNEAWELEWLLREANAEIPFQPHIVIAATPDDLPAGTAIALVGGAYHEAWHTRYSTRRTLKVSEVEGPLMERWGKADVKFWKSQHGVMLSWSNIIEDIRIERLGCARFPGALPKMEALQDLILKTEQEGFEKQMPENLLLTMIGCVFRDIGLGYDTPRQQIALAFYERVCPEAVAFVNGPLRPMLDKAINLPESADMEPIWMAMDIALLLRDLAEEQPQDAESEGESEGGEGGGAPDADQDESEDESEGAGGGASKPEKGDESKPEKGGGKGKPEKGEGDAPKPEQGEGDDAEGDDAEGDDDGDSDDGDSNGGKDAGGQSVLNDDQIRELAAALIEAIANDAKMDVKDVSQALEQAINAAFNQDVEQGEMPWRSPCPEEDKVAYAGVRDGKAGFAVRNKVRNEIAALRARLRNKFLAARTPSYTHGVRKGVDMSERRMVDSIIEINMGMEPTRPDYQKDKKNDCSLAVALVIDESGSMSGLRKETVKGAVAIADALSSLGCPVLAIGPRNHNGYCGDNTSGCHRHQPVRIDVFKDWNETMTTALPRFPSITATGGTPLEDGIQYALQELNKRTERHRIVLTITDGVPDNPQVVRNQIRLSADAQIKIVGIGLGYAGDSVGHLFPEHLSVPQIENLPAMLASYLEGVMFPSRAKKIEGVAKSFKAA